MILNTSCY